MLQIEEEHADESLNDISIASARQVKTENEPRSLGVSELVARLVLAHDDVLVPLDVGDGLSGVFERSEKCFIG